MGLSRMMLDPMRVSLLLEIDRPLTRQSTPRRNLGTKTTPKLLCQRPAQYQISNIQHVRTYVRKRFNIMSNQNIVLTFFYIASFQIKMEFGAGPVRYCLGHRVPLTETSTMLSKMTRRKGDG